MAGQGFLNLVSGEIKQIKAIQSSSGVADAGKIIALDSNGKLDASVLAASNTFRPSKENAFFSTDFTQAAGIPDPWSGSAHASGTITSPSSSFYNGQNNGLIEVRASASANSGYSFRTGQGEILLSGGEITNFVFMPRTASTSLVGRFGFHDTMTTGSAPTDAVMFTLTGNGTNAVIAGACSSNSSSSTVALGNLTVDTFYHGRITIGASAANAVFEIFDMSGTLLYTGTVSANVPSSTGRTTAHAAQFFHTAGSTGLALVVLDWMDFSFPNRQRGAL